MKLVEKYEEKGFTVLIKNAETGYYLNVLNLNIGAHGYNIEDKKKEISQKIDTFLNKQIKSFEDLAWVIEEYAMTYITDAIATVDSDSVKIIYEKLKFDVNEFE